MRPCIKCNQLPCICTELKRKQRLDDELELAKLRLQVYMLELRLKN